MIGAVVYTIGWIYADSEHQRLQRNRT